MLTIEVVGCPSPRDLENIAQAIFLMGAGYEYTRVSYAPSVPRRFETESGFDATDLIIRGSNTPWSDNVDDMEQIGKIAKILHEQTQMKISVKVINHLSMPVA